MKAAALRGALCRTGLTHGRIHVIERIVDSARHRPLRVRPRDAGQSDASTNTLLVLSRNDEITALSVA